VPRMNARADVLMGGGGMPGSVNQRPYPFGSYGRGAFRDNDTILVALASAGGSVYAWRPLEDPDGLRLELVDARVFNGIAGGGGRFAAIAAPPPPADPYLFGSLGTIPKAGAGDVAFDGTIAYKTLYHANNGITIVDPAGLVVERPDAFPVDVQALAGGRAVWRGGAHGRDPLRPTLADAMNIRVAENVIPGVDVIAYWSNAASALVVEEDGAGVGFMFRTQNGFDHDVIGLNGEAILAASRTAGEGPGDLVKIAITRGALRYLVPADGQAPPWFPAPTWGPITIDPPIDPIEPIAVTITATPAHGPAPLTVIAIATITNGPATSIAWRWRPQGDPDWRISVVNPGGDPDHTLRFDTPGAYEINAVVEGKTSRGSSDIELVTATSKPPDPPQPKPFRTLTKGLTMEIDGKIVQLRGAGLRLIAPDAPGTGIWKEIDGKPTQWRGVLYVADGGSSSRYRAKKIPGDRYLFTNVDHDCLAGADGGAYSTGLDRQGYHKPTGDTDAGDLEQWRVYEGNEAGTIQAQIEQTSDSNHPAGPGKKIVVFPLTVEIVQ
jgi:PKD repeat protein